MSRSGSKGSVAEGGSRRESKRGSSKAEAPPPEPEPVVEAVPEPQDLKWVRPDGPVRVLVLQCEPFEDVAKAMKHLDDAVGEAGGNIDFAVFPEGFLRNKAVTRSTNCRQDLEDPILLEFASAAERHKMYLVAGAVDEQGENAKYRTAFCFGRDGGLLLRYRKVAPGLDDQDGTKERKAWYTFGTEFQRSTFDTEFGKVGTCIGTDTEQDDMLKEFLQQGVNLMLNPIAIRTKSGKTFSSNASALKTSREAAFDAHCTRFQSMAKEFDCTFVRADLASGKVEANGCMPMGTSLVVGPSQVRQAETATASSFVVELGQQLPVVEKRISSKVSPHALAQVLNPSA